VKNPILYEQLSYYKTVLYTEKLQSMNHIDFFDFINFLIILKKSIYIFKNQNYTLIINKLTDVDFFIIMINKRRGSCEVRSWEF
jgi:hypothetical protein